MVIIKKTNINVCLWGRKTVYIRKNDSVFFQFKQEDYYLTPDKLWIPLRWIAPELLEEFRGELVVTDQTKTSNVWYVPLFVR